MGDGIFRTEDQGIEQCLLLHQVKEIPLQVSILRKYFPWLHDAAIVPAHVPHAHVEGFYAIPHWEVIAPSYGQAVQSVFDQLSRARGGAFMNFREGQLGERFLRVTERTREMRKQITACQKGNDILVIPAQTGKFHRCETPATVRAGYAKHEFGLTLFDVAIILLTHLERLSCYGDLWIDCPGDESSSTGDGEYHLTPFFSCGTGDLECGAATGIVPEEHYGSATGFLCCAVEVD